MIASFGELLRIARWNANLTQEELAERAGISTRAISDLERGINRSPRRDTLAMLAQALGLSDDERAGWESARRLLASRVPHRATDAQPERQVRGNLPTPLTSFVGRSEEVQRISDLLRRGDARLVSLTGTGGVGKTRLGIAIAMMLEADFTDGVWFVDLAQIRDPDLVVPTILSTLEIAGPDDRSPTQVLAEALRSRKALLLLDNLEHVIQASPQISEIIRACPDVSVVATTRVPLHIQGEHEFLLAPLTVPRDLDLSSAEDALASASVELFVDRARAVRPEFELAGENIAAVVGICRHLDGIPLAIELASVHIRALPPPSILERLEHPLPFLTGGSVDLPPRQQTLLNTLAWSYDLLPEETQHLLREVSVFQGGWTFDAVTALTGLDDATILEQTEQLVEHSLVQVEDRASNDPRFSMLDTIREFGIGQLAGEAALRDVQRRHAQVMLQIARQARDASNTPQHSDWLNRLERERANLNAALQFSIDEDPRLALELTTSLYGFWYVRGPMREGSRWLERALENSADYDPELRALALYQCGEFARVRGNFAQASELGAQSLDIARESGNRAGVALALFLLGNAASSDMRFDAAVEHFTESLRIYRELDNRERIAFVLNNLAQVFARQGDPDRAQPLFEEALATWPAPGSNWGRMITFVGLGELARDRQDYNRARDYYMESLQLFHELDDRWSMCECLYDLAETMLMLGDPKLSVCLFSVAADLREELGMVPSDDQAARQQQVLEQARQALDTQTFWSTWADCRQMEIQDILDLLL